MDAIERPPIVSSLRAIAAATSMRVKPPLEAHSHWREEVCVVYCVGKGEFGPINAGNTHETYINLKMDMFDLHGNYVGFQLGVHRSLATPQELLAVPPPPNGATNQPVGPVPRLPIREWTKGIWTFADGSEIHAVGQAQSHLTPFKDGSFLFTVATGQTIVHGTGRYEGAHGTKQATGSAYIPAGVTFPLPGLTFDAKTIEVFRVVKGRYIGARRVQSPPSERQKPEHRGRRRQGERDRGQPE